MIDTLIQSKFKMVIAVTGGGTGAINELLKDGGGSAVLLEAIVPYCTKSIEQFLGRTPEKYCSLETAKMLAHQAFQRASDLTESERVFGVGATSSLIKQNGIEREGREHRVYVTVTSLNNDLSVEKEVTYVKNRQVQEGIATQLILETILKFVNESF